MSPKLKPLLLPQLVEERRKKESRAEGEMDLFASYYHQNSSSSSQSEVPSPVTPTFSTRSHLRYPSSVTSVDSAYHNSATDSPSSPTFTKAGKRSLPDVQEEPQERDDDDFCMFEDGSDLYDCLCRSMFTLCSERGVATNQARRRKIKLLWGAIANVLCFRRRSPMPAPRCEYGT
jgi:hypothetical protein